MDMWKKIKNQIPNIFTSANLFSGTVGILFAVEDQFIPAFICMLISGVLDFFDGFVARLLGVASPIGKQLDSLADVVTFGVLPGIFMYQFYFYSGGENWSAWPAYTAFLIPVFSAYRLAVFNLDETQSDRFRGLNTPTNALFIASMVCYFVNQQTIPAWMPYVIPPVSVVLSLLLVSRISLIAFKFKGKLQGREWLKIIFVIISLLSVVFLNFAAAGIILPLYFIISFIYYRKA